MTKDRPLEAKIIARLKAGEADALAVVYDRYATVVHRIAFGLLRDAAEAEDLTHDVFVGLSRAVRTFEGRGSFDAWLRRVTVRTALMRLRRQRLQRGYVQQQRRLPSPVHSDTSAERLDLEQALAGLAPPLRAVFVLKEVHGYSHAEIGEVLGISTTAARARLCRARRILRSQLTRD